MKVIKIIIPIIAIILLCGCSDNKEVKIDDDYDYDLVTFCDKQYGVEYIRDVGAYRGGITVRLDENGNVIHCKKGE